MLDTDIKSDTICSSVIGTDQTKERKMKNTLTIRQQINQLKRREAARGITWIKCRSKDGWIEAKDQFGTWVRVTGIK